MRPLTRETWSRRCGSESFAEILALFAAERRICEHYIAAVFVLNISQVLGKRVGMDDVRCLDVVQDHVHDRDDIAEGLLLLTVGVIVNYCPE